MNPIALAASLFCALLAINASVRDLGIGLTVFCASAAGVSLALGLAGA